MLTTPYKSRQEFIAVFFHINPNPDGWGLYDSRNFEKKQVKMAWNKNTFYPRSIAYKMC